MNPIDLFKKLTARLRRDMAGAENESDVEAIHTDALLWLMNQPGVTVLRACSMMSMALVSVVVEIKAVERSRIDSALRGSTGRWN